MKLLFEHFFTALSIGCIGWFVSGNFYCVPSALIAGWFIDLDHLCDFLIHSIRSKNINLSLIGTGEYFKINNGEYIEQGSESRSVKVSNGIDPFTGREFSQKSSPSKAKNALRRTTADALFEEPMSFRVSLSKTQAKAHSAGYAALVRYNIPAKAVAIGDPRIRPYSLVNVEGTGEQSDGYWLVDSVKHVFNKTGAYMAELKLLSDGTGKNKASSTRQATVGITGTVNLVEALRKKKSSLATVSKSTLSSKTALIKETGQGFNRTPARWKATRKK
jgi:hypothetical protein